MPRLATTIHDQSGTGRVVTGAGSLGQTFGEDGMFPDVRWRTQEPRPPRRVLGRSFRDDFAKGFDSKLVQGAKYESVLN